jgi:hypothetical protein
LQLVGLLLSQFIRSISYCASVVACAVHKYSLLQGLDAQSTI